MFTVAPAAEQPVEALHAALLAAYSDYVAGPVVLALADWPSFIARQVIDLALSRVAISWSRQRVSTCSFTSSSGRSREGVIPTTSNQM
jgi:hypothetical protein